MRDSSSKFFDFTLNESAFSRKRNHHLPPLRHRMHFEIDHEHEPATGNTTTDNTIVKCKAKQRSTITLLTSTSPDEWIIGSIIGWLYHCFVRQLLHQLKRPNTFEAIWVLRRHLNFACRKVYCVLIGHVNVRVHLASPFLLIATYVIKMYDDQHKSSTRPWLHMPSSSSSSWHYCMHWACAW